MPSRILKPTSPRQALHKLVEAIRLKIVDYEELPVSEAIGRVLFEDIVSKVNIPKNDVSVMDGYAIRYRDTLTASTKNPVRLTVIGKQYLSESPSEIKIEEGQAVYITTGAPIPMGADAVVMVEYARVVGDQIELRKAVKEGDFITRAGKDIPEGLVLKKGSVLRPQDIGLLTGIWEFKVKTLRKPKVAVLPVGDELTDLDDRKLGKKVDNYSLIISGLIEELGAEPQKMDVAPDDPKEIANRISSVIDMVDMIVTISGISVGEKDMVSEAVVLLEPGGLLVHGVKMKPGRVTGLGVIRGKPFIALPGHIISTIAGFYTFAAPTIAYMLGLGFKAPLPILKAKITREVKGAALLNFIPVSVKILEEGFVAEPVLDDSSVLRSMIKANGFIYVDPGGVIEEGKEVDVTLFGVYELSYLYA